MTKLYWSKSHSHHWIGYTDDTGYVLFPAQEGGWERRKPLYGVDIRSLRAVPARLSFNTGFPADAKERARSVAA